GSTSEPAWLEATLEPDSAYPVPSRPGGAAPLLAWRRGAAGAPVALGPVTAEGRALELRARAAPGRAARWRFLLAASPRVAADLQRIARTPHASLLDRADLAWAQVRSRAARLHLGDPALEAAVDDALFVLAGC